MASDDVSVGREQSGIVGRRGLAGVTLIHKLAGAMAHKVSILCFTFSTYLTHFKGRKH